MNEPGLGARLRIGLMLRSFDEQGGVGVYSRNIVRELLALPSDHHFVLFFRRSENVGLFAGHPNVSEIYVPGGHKLFWDQIAIPLAARRQKIDILFHPKFTAPFLVGCPVVMVVHGADWFMPDQHHYYSSLDVGYIRAVMPWYFRKCRRVISVSQLTTENFNKVLRLPAGKVETIYFGPARHFARVVDVAQLRVVRERYRLPERFLLTLTKVNGDRRKNLGNLLRGYAAYHALTEMPLPLVVGGKDCYQLRQKYDLPEDGFGADILFPGWLAQEDLPAIYTMATAYVYPSNLEAFPIPLTEAMACGTPIVTSNVNGLQEIAGEAAMLVPPDDIEAIARAILELTLDEEKQRQLSRLGRERSRRFSWPKCAKATLRLLESASRPVRPGASTP